MSIFAHCADRHLSCLCCMDLLCHSHPIANQLHSVIVGQPGGSDSSIGTPNSDGKPGRPGVEGQPGGSNGTPGPATEFPCGAPGPLAPGFLCTPCPATEFPCGAPGLLRPGSLCPGANKGGNDGQAGAPGPVPGIGGPPGWIGFQPAFQTQAISRGEHNIIMNDCTLH